MGEPILWTGELSSKPLNIRDSFQRWAREHPDQARSALTLMKRGLGSARTRRANRLTFFRTILPSILEARAELRSKGIIDQGETANKRVADWLNDKRIRTSQRKSWSHKQIDELGGLTKSIAEDAVLECRTKMTARLLSADFATDGELERECIDQIAEAMALVRKLDGFGVADPDWLRSEARYLAIKIAKTQRDTTYFPMIARECLMTPDEFERLSAFRLESVA